MLILTRDIGKTVRFGDHITLTILAIKGAQVKIGIEAPKNTMVHREEVYERIQNEKKLSEIAI